MKTSILYTTYSIRRVLIALVIVFLVIGSFSLGSSESFAWLGPASNPPGGNVPARIDTSSNAQTKVGSLSVSGTLGIGTTSPDPSALLDVSSVSQGILFPRLTSTQLSSVSSPPAGLMAFNSTTQQLNSYTNTWSAVGGSGGGLWTASGSQLYYTSGNVGIGDTSPAAQLSVNGSISAPASSTLRLGATGSTAGVNNNGSIYFLDSSGVVRTRFDAATPISSQLNVGWWKMDEASGLTVADSSGNGGTATGTDYPKPVGWWAMNEASGNTVADGSGNGNTGTGVINSQGLLAWWKMDETSGSSVADSSGSGYTGTAVGTTITTTGQKYGTAARVLNGSTDYITTGNINTLGAFTYEAWVNMTSTAGTQMIFDKEIGGQYWPSVRMYIASGVPYVDFYTANSTQHVVAATSALSPGAWYHLAGVYNGGTLFIYINGVLSNSNAQSGTPNTITNNLTIGAIQYNSVPYYRANFNGIIDDVRIHSVALTQAQIISDMNDTLYPAPTVVSGQYGNARSFNGFNYIDIPNSTVFDVANYTIEAWVYSTNFSQYGFIFEKGPVNTQYSFFFEGSNIVQRSYNSAGTLFINQYTALSTAGITNGNWYHLASVYTGSAIQLYVNGVLKSNVAVSGTLRTGQTGERIGAYGGATPAYFYTGSIDDVRVYGVALSQAQIQADMNNNTFTGPTVVAGKYSNARQFNGATEYMSVPNSSVLNPAKITIEAWINPTVFQAGNFVDKGDNSGYRFRTLSGGLVQFLDRGGTNDLSSVTPLSTGVWSHVAVTGDSSGLKIYINGNLDASNAVAYGGPSTSNPLVFGAYGTSAEYYYGKLDDVRIYNYALNQTQIQNDMTGSAPPGNTAYGTFYTGATNVTSQDLAEYYESADSSLAPGMLVSLDAQGKLQKATQADSSLLGIISTNPGVTLGTNDTGSNHNQQRVALAGKVPTLVTTTNGPIQPGDLITLDPNNPGIGIKLTTSGWYVGRALQPLAQGQGTIEVFAQSGYWNDPNQSLQSSVQSIIGSLVRKAGGVIDNTGLHFDSLVGHMLDAGIVKAPHIDLIDSATGDLYCVTIQGGQLNKTQGVCNN